MACVSIDLACALSYSLQQLGTPNLILKPEQRSVIEMICNGKNTFAWLPTGFEKSICYQTLPFVFDKMSRKCAAGGNVVVVSPLISLMEDQVASLRKRGSMQPLVSPEAVSRMSFVLLTMILAKTVTFLCSRSSHQFQVEGSTRTRT